MYQRKIQLVAGSSYSISLPKEWIRKNNLKEQQNLQLYEGNDRSLTISPQSREERKVEEISINVDDYHHNIDQILLAVYYLGTEVIHLHSQKELQKETKARIRKALSCMSGTEISYEDKHTITIKVLLDKSKVDLTQLIYRINLIIDSSISNITDEFNIEEVRINENEIDRLYQLIVKIISLSLIDTNVLHSSEIRNISLIPSYFLISKRLENISDSLYNLAEHYYQEKNRPEGIKSSLSPLKEELGRTITHLLKPTNIFEKTSEPALSSVRNSLSSIKNTQVRNYIEEIMRFLVDIEEEVVIISFYKKLFLAEKASN